MPFNGHIAITPECVEYVYSPAVGVTYTSPTYAMKEAWAFWKPAQRRRTDMRSVVDRTCGPISNPLVRVYDNVLAGLTQEPLYMHIWYCLGENQRLHVWQHKLFLKPLWALRNGTCWDWLILIKVVISAYLTATSNNAKTNRQLEFNTGIETCDEMCTCALVFSRTTMVIMRGLHDVYILLYFRGCQLST